jgi:hypothetical protein
MVFLQQRYGAEHQRPSIVPEFWGSFQICDNAPGEYAEPVEPTVKNYSSEEERKGGDEVTLVMCSNLESAATSKGVRARKTPSASSDADGVFQFSAPTPHQTVIPGATEPPDLAIEMPDFHVAAVDKLPRGLQGLRVGIGVDRPV